MNTRTALVAVALAFGVWETSDIPDTKAPAAAFAVLFLVCAAVVWRRCSRVAALCIGLLCTVEATQAHTWKDAGSAAKLAAEVLGSAGIALTAAFLVRPLIRRSHA
jgi:hypothetical protein